MKFEDAHFPGRAPIDAYGDGGFRFAGMSHRGSLLFLPSGVYAWAVNAIDEVDVAAFDRVIDEAGEIEILLLGCGPDIRVPPATVRERLAEAGISLEFMATGAAARTFNVLLAEERAVAAALIAVDSP